MGVPLTRFSMLSRIMQRGRPRDWKDELEKDVAHDFFGQFNLYAIVLCKHDNQDFISYIPRTLQDLIGEPARTFCSSLWLSLASQRKFREPLHINETT